MKVDAGLVCALGDVPREAPRLEGIGFDGLLAAETSHDPLFPLLLAAEHTDRGGLVTPTRVAFARSPMTVAAQAHALQSFSRGRLVLGLGSQIKPHITKRFSMPWSKPAARMREYILALRAIWECWYENAGQGLDFRGEFYTHRLMTPMFTPQDVEHGAPRVWLAAVGPLMCETAGEVADGLIAHAFATSRYLREVTLPAVERGLERAGRARDSFEVVYPGFVVSGSDEREMQRRRTAVCKQIAFYGSTPAYRPVLELHGWGELQDELNAMSKRGLWDEMGRQIDDDVLSEFALVGAPEELPDRFAERFGGLVDRTSSAIDWAAEEHRGEILARLRSL